MGLTSGCLWAKSETQHNLAEVRFAPILLKKSKVASVPMFDAILNREAIGDSDISSRVTEVGYEFCVRR